MSINRNDAELAKFDEFGNVKVSFSSSGDLVLNDFEDIAPITYVGKSNGVTYLIEEITELSVGLSKRYASIANNPTILTYSDAWTNRSTLTYSLR